MALRLLIPGVKSKMRRVALVRLSRAQWVFQVVYFGKAFECSPNWAALAFLRAQIPVSALLAVSIPCRRIPTTAGAAASTLKLEKCARKRSRVVRDLGPSKRQGRKAA
jgi:hypothetical protein